MEWVIVYIIPIVIGIILSALTGWYAGIIITIIVWSIIYYLILDCFDEDYNDWVKSGCIGEHPWFEWNHCKKDYANIKKRYNTSNCCKIKFDTFNKYFQVNNKRYSLKPGYAICKNDSTPDIIMIFRRIDLFKYFKFRRNYMQSVQMMKVLEMVQSDIDEAQRIAQEQINLAREQIKLRFGDENK